MHHIYSTKAFVLNSFPFGEAGKVLVLLTNDLGVIKVVAQGTRKIESKLRQSIQDYSLADFSLVYGKGGWRLINASIEKSYFSSYGAETIIIISRIFTLIQRMVPEEEASSEIFSIMTETFKLLDKNKELEGPTKIPNNIIEIFAVLKIMHSLGYIADEFDLYDKLEQKNDMLLEYVKNNEKLLVDLINQAIKESHL